MRLQRRTGPVQPLVAGDDGFLYVPEEDMDEALALGARRMPGEARLVIPKPLPAGVSAVVYARWRTDDARYRWCMRLVGRILEGMVPVADMDELMRSLGDGVSARGRIYLWVPAYDAEHVRGLTGVAWDKRHQMYFATEEANLNDLFSWLTPSARVKWESERAMQKGLTLMVQDQARRVAAGWNPGGNSPDVGAGAPKHKKEPSRTVPSQ